MKTKELKLKTEINQTLPLYSGDRTLWKRTLELWVFTMLKSPMIFFVRPYITHLDNARTQILVKLNRKNKNPYGSMYFGSLTVGAEVVPGITVVTTSRQLNIPVSFLVKKFNGNYKLTAKSDMIFVSTDNAAIKQTIIDSSKDGSAKALTITVNAYNKGSDEIAASFVIEMSLKAKKAKL
jgi:hypothetical protein